MNPFHHARQRPAVRATAQVALLVLLLFAGVAYGHDQAAPTYDHTDLVLPTPGAPVTCLVAPSVAVQPAVDTWAQRHACGAPNRR